MKENMKKQEIIKPEPHGRLGVATWLGVSLGIAAIILSCFGGFSLLLWIAGILDANVRHENRTMLSGVQTNWSATPSGNAKYDQTDENTNKPWRSIGKLSGEIFRADNETGVATDSHDKKPIPYPDGKDSANRWQRLDTIMESDGEILIRVIIHVMRDVTPNSIIDLNSAGPI